jgi:hypothetical protein
VGLGEQPGAKRDFGETDERPGSASNHRATARSAPSVDSYQAIAHAFDVLGALIDGLRQSGEVNWCGEPAAARFPQ